MTDISALITERSKTHGHYPDVAATAQRLKEVCRNSPNWHSLNPGQKESFEMQCMKWARILCGDPDEPDHWNDIAGYAKLGADCSASAIKDKAERGWLNDWRSDQKSHGGNAP